MGVDVEMRLAEKTFVTQDEIDRFQARFPDPHLGRYDRSRWPDLLHNGAVMSMHRLFDHGYPRGPWPEIKAMILWLRNEFGQDVRYGGDSSYYADSDDPADWPPIITDQDIASLDALWDVTGPGYYAARMNAAVSRISGANLKETECPSPSAHRSPSEKATSSSVGSPSNTDGSPSTATPSTSSSTTAPISSAPRSPHATSPASSSTTASTSAATDPPASSSPTSPTGSPPSPQGDHA